MRVSGKYAIRPTHQHQEGRAIYEPYGKNGIRQASAATLLRDNVWRNFSCDSRMITQVQMAPRWKSPSAR